MHEKTGKTLYILLSAAILLSAVYALGLLGRADVRNVDRKEYKEEGFTFSGSLVDGRIEGRCQIMFADGSSYSGSILGGRFSGEGSYTSADGWLYNGKFDEGLAIDGAYHFTNGETVRLSRDGGADALTSANWTYTGGFGDLGQNGSGVFVFSDGSVYTGGFAGGFAEGEGSYTDASGRLVYEGGFSGGLFEGIGVYHSPDGWTYAGGFKNGLFDGPGVITDNAQEITGVWEEGTQQQ